MMMSEKQYLIILKSWEDPLARYNVRGTIRSQTAVIQQKYETNG